MPNKHDSGLSTMQARTAVDFINRNTGTLSDSTTIKMELKKAYHALIKTGIYPVESHCLLLAFLLSYLHRKAVKDGYLSVIDYIRMLATAKERNEIKHNDYGAFGDLYEVLIRCALIGNLSLVRWSALAVKDIYRTDVVSKKYGVVEIGHNGKTWSNGSYFDFMAGDFTSVIYGVFNNEDMRSIYDLCKAGNVSKAIDYVSAYSVYWADKYTFLHDIDGLTRGKGIAIKSGKIMSQYNAGKYNAFVGAIESGKFISLADTLTK